MIASSHPLAMLLPEGYSHVRHPVRFGPALPEEPPAALHRLTPAEADVLRLMAEGLSNDDIARERGCSRHTVRHFTHVVLQKLGVRNRTSAVVLYLRWAAVQGEGGGE